MQRIALTSSIVNKKSKIVNTEGRRDGGHCGGTRQEQRLSFRVEGIAETVAEEIEGEEGDAEEEGGEKEEVRRDI